MTTVGTGSRIRSWCARWENLAVAGAWAGSLVLGLAFVGRFGSNVPYWDDFDFVDPLLDGRLFSPEWLWSVQANHRFPLPKAILGALLSASRPDFRWTQYYNVLCLAAAALAFLRIVALRRGSLRLSDAALPLLLMHLGTGGSLLRTLAVTTFVLLVGLLFWAIADRGRGFGAGRLAIVGWLLVPLMLTGAGGLVLSLAVLAWFFIGLAVDGCRTGLRECLRGRVPELAAFGTAAILAVAAASGAGEAIEGGSPPSALQAARVALQVVGQGFGPAGALGWAREGYGGVPVPLLSLAALGLLLAGIVVHGRGALSRGTLLSPEGLSTALLAGFLGIAVAVGLGRSGLRDDFGLQNHYGFLMAPGLAAVYAGLASRGGGGALRAFRWGFYSLVVALWVFHLQVGMRDGKERRSRMREFEADARAGLGGPELARRYTPFLSSQEEKLSRLLSRMKAAGLPPFEGR